MQGSGPSVTIDQAGVGLEIVNPTASSTVDNVNVWRFNKNSILIDNHAASRGSGMFQLSDFFVGNSPHPLEVRGSRARILLRFGGIDLGPASQLGMLFDGDQKGATSVVESVKIEGDYDVPGYVVNRGSAGRLRRCDPLPQPEPLCPEPRQQCPRLHLPQLGGAANERPPMPRLHGTRRANGARPA